MRGISVILAAAVGLLVILPAASSAEQPQIHRQPGEGRQAYFKRALSELPRTWKKITVIEDTASVSCGKEIIPDILAGKFKFISPTIESTRVGGSFKEYLQNVKAICGADLLEVDMDDNGLMLRPNKNPTLFDVNTDIILVLDGLCDGWPGCSDQDRAVNGINLPSCRRYYAVGLSELYGSHATGTGGIVSFRGATFIFQYAVGDDQVFRFDQVGPKDDRRCLFSADY